MRFYRQLGIAVACLIGACGRSESPVTGSVLPGDGPGAGNAGGGGASPAGGAGGAGGAAGGGASGQGPAGAAGDGAAGAAAGAGGSHAGGWPTAGAGGEPAAGAGGEPEAGAAGAAGAPPATPECGAVYDLLAEAQLSPAQPGQPGLAPCPAALFPLTAAAAEVLGVDPQPSAPPGALRVRVSLSIADGTGACGAVLDVTTFGGPISFSAGERIRVSNREQSNGPGLTRSVGVFSEAGELLLGVSTAATTATFPTEIFGGIKFGASTTLPCQGPPSGGEAVRLWTPQLSCPIQPYKSGCCALPGGPFEVRVRGAYPAIGASRVADLLLSAPGRFGGPSTPCEAPP